VRAITVLYWVVILTCVCMSVSLCLPASTWLSFINSIVSPSEGQFQKISDLFFSDSKISLYRTIAVVPLLLSLILFWKRNLFSGMIFHYSLTLKTYVRHLWKVQGEILLINKKRVLLLFFIFPIIFLCYYSGKFPFTVDEAFSWVHLVNKGPLVSAFYYPAPNNHIFYTVLCSLLNYLPLDPVWVMRIPTVIAYLFCIHLLYLMLRRLLDHNAAFYTIFLFSIQPSILYYALHGRGYIFLVLFVILSCWFLYSALVNNVKPAYVGFVLSCVLGFYTIPVFLYYFILLATTAGVYIVWYKAWDRLIVLVVAFVSIVLLTSLFYLPVFMLNGTDAVFNNSWVQPQTYSFAQVYAYLREVLTNVSGLNGILLLTALLIIPAFFILFYYEKKYFRWLIVAMLLWVPLLAILLIIQQVLPYERIWIPFSVVWILIIVWLEAWLDEVGKVRWLGTALVYFMIYISFTDLRKNFNKADSYYEQLHAFVDMVDPEQVNSVYSADDTYLVMLQVKFARAHKEAAFTTIGDLHGQNADLRIIPLNDIDKELISVDEERFFANSYMVAYRRKGLQILR
jgi:hypothetical protein